MKNYYFISREYNRDCHSITLEAWKDDGSKGRSFCNMEYLRLFACKNYNSYHCLMFNHNKGINLHNISSAQTELDFIYSMCKQGNYPFTQISQKNYLRLKKHILEIYNNYPDIDFDTNTLKLE
ncbi:MAG: hypothetical protein LBS50_08250 [Prevotellaceae bacterium]|jgi:hypothetical protein|nr:hypothetical protein [Prevotellaceae bacterium]